MTLLSSFTSSMPLVLLGGGKMGGAMLDGWLAAGVAPDAVIVIDPMPSDALRSRASEVGFAVVASPPDAAPRALVLAVKPQVMAEALAPLAGIVTDKTLVVSIAAGKALSFFEERFSPAQPIVRAMPNTPVAVGRGVSALFANASAGPADRALVEALASAVGEAVWLNDESEMDAVTGVSGSGPAYVFHMIEALAKAAEAAGLAPETAMVLARQTVIGAAELAHQSGTDAGVLRENVTSPGGTTAAGLSVLMRDGDGLCDLMRETVSAAAQRSRDLA